MPTRRRAALSAIVPITQLARAVVAEVRERLPPWLGGRGPFVGAYPDFASVRDSVRELANAYHADAWIEASLAEARMLRDTEAADHWQIKSRELAPLAIALLGGRGPVQVVDFGGSIGFSYLLLKKRLTAAAQIAYHVIDTPRVCAAGREFFAGDPAIRFHESDAFVDELPPGGLLQLANSLQYVDDWRAQLARLVRYRPAHILFTQLTAGDHPAFVTMQRNMPGARMPHWIFAQADIVAAVEALDYELVYASRCQTPLNQIHHPAAQRIGHFRNLLFTARARSPRA